MAIFTGAGYAGAVALGAGEGITISLLGSPVVQRDGQRLHFDTRKAVAMLAVLAADGGEHSRDRLAALLWPDSDGERSRGALRRTLSVTRAAVGSALHSDRARIGLDRGLVLVDVWEFETLVNCGDRQSLERAALLYRGDFLAGFGLKDSSEFDDWQDAAAERWRSRFASALERLAALAEEAGEFGAAVDWARRWLDLDPLQEPAHQALIRLYSRSGQRAAAVRQYRDCVQVLDRELGVAPLEETTAAYEEVLAPALPGRAGSASSPAVFTGAFPQPPESGAGPGPGTAFVGRARELAALRDSWSRVATSGQAVAVIGEPGSGKTALVQRFAQGLTDQDLPVLRVRCHEGEEGIPYGVAAELLGAAVARRPDLAMALPPQIASEVARIRPELGPPPAEPHRMADPRGSTAMIRLLSSVGAALMTALRTDSTPTRAGVLLVEDLHLADARSQELMVYLLNRLERYPVLVVLTWAPDRSERLTVVQVAISKCAEAGAGQLLELGRFDLLEVEELLEIEGASRDEAERILRDSRGLPLLVAEYARAEARGLSADGALAPTVRDVLRSWVDVLAEPARQLVSAAAVLGGVFDPDLLRAVSGRGETEVEEALELAVRRSILVALPELAFDGATQYDFPYEALREVAYATSTASRRRILHRRAAEALRRRHDRDPAIVAPGTIASHWERAGRELEAASWWWRAAERARVLFAHEEALDRMAQALALGYARLPALVGTGEVLTTLGRYREALDAFQAAAAEARGSNPALAEIEHKIADVYARRGDLELAENHFTTALELVSQTDGAARARLGAELALVAHRAGHTARARQVASQALVQARRSADKVAQARALNALGVLAGRERRSAEAEELLREALNGAREAGNEEVEVAALNNLARVLAEAGRAEDALAAASDALDAGSRLRDRHRVAALQTNLADVLHATGRDESAREHMLESARGFAMLDSADEREPAIWELVEW